MILKFQYSQERLFSQVPKDLDIRIFNPKLSASQELWCSVYLVLLKSCKLLKRSVDMFGMKQKE